MFVGGDILEISYKHPTLGAGVFLVKSGEDFTLDTGGFRSEDSDDLITGNGVMIDRMNNKRWSAEGMIAWDTVTNDEANQLTLLTASTLLADWTFTHISGAIWGGKGKPVGDIKPSSKDATLSMKIAGTGRLEKIS